MNQTKVKVKNGTITLPRSLQNAWKEAEVFLFPSQDTLILKRIQKNLDDEWNRYEEKLQKGIKKISKKVIDEAVGWAKKQS